MAKVRFDMVAESSTTTGTGTITLTGAKNPGISFSAAGVATSDTFKYCIKHDTLNEWETGTGTLASSTTFTRSVLRSSNSNSLVNFSAGNKTVELVLDSADISAMEIGTGGLQTVLGTVTSGNVDAVVSAASDTVAGKIEIAIQSEMEAGSDTIRAVTPGRQHFHPSAIKCFGFTTGGGTPALHANSYNMTSITDTATGRLTVTIGTDFSSANWCGVATSTASVSNANRMMALLTKAVGSVIIESSSASTTLSDPGNGWNWIFVGDL